MKCHKIQTYYLYVSVKVITILKGNIFIIKHKYAIGTLHSCLKHDRNFALILLCNKWKRRLKLLFINFLKSVSKQNCSLLPYAHWHLHNTGIINHTVQAVDVRPPATMHVQSREGVGVWGQPFRAKWSDLNLIPRPLWCLSLHGEIISEVKWAAGRRVSHYTILRRSARTVQEMHID